MDDARAALYLYHKHRKVRRTQCYCMLVDAAAWLNLVCKESCSTLLSEGWDTCRTGSCTCSRVQSAS